MTRAEDAADWENTWLPCGRPWFHPRHCKIEAGHESLLVQCLLLPNTALHSGVCLAKEPETHFSLEMNISIWLSEMLSLLLEACLRVLSQLVSAPLTLILLDRLHTGVLASLRHLYSDSWGIYHSMGISEATSFLLFLCLVRCHIKLAAFQGQCFLPGSVEPPVSSVVLTFLSFQGASSTNWEMLYPCRTVIHPVLGLLIFQD